MCQNRHRHLHPHRTTSSAAEIGKATQAVPDHNLTAAGRLRLALGFLALEPRAGAATAAPDLGFVAWPWRRRHRHEPAGLPGEPQRSPTTPVGVGAHTRRSGLARAAVVSRTRMTRR